MHASFALGRASCMKTTVCMCMSLVILTVSGCGEDNLKTFGEFVASDARYTNVTLRVLNTSAVRDPSGAPTSQALGQDWDYTLEGYVERMADLRSLVEAVYRMDLDKKISLEVKVRGGHTYRKVEPKEAVSNEDSSIRNLRELIAGDPKYGNIALEPIVYPRSSFTRKHSIEAGLGPEWEYTLMGAVESLEDLHNLIGSLHAWQLQAIVSVDVDIVTVEREEEQAVEHSAPPAGGN